MKINFPCFTKLVDSCRERIEKACPNTCERISNLFEREISFYQVCKEAYSFGRKMFYDKKTWHVATAASFAMTSIKGLLNIAVFKMSFVAILSNYFIKQLLTYISSFGNEKDKDKRQYCIEKFCQLLLPISLFCLLPTSALMIKTLTIGALITSPFYYLKDGYNSYSEEQYEKSKSLGV